MKDIKLDDKIVIGKIVELKVHPNADKLKVAQVSLGFLGTNQIVCGAPNVKEGQIVPVVLPGGRIGSAKQEIVVAKAKIRGVESKGMMSSPFELGLNKDNDTILILPKNLEKYLGQPLAKFLSQVKASVSAKPKLAQENKVRRVAIIETLPDWLAEQKTAKLIWQSWQNLAKTEKLNLSFLEREEIVVEHPANFDHGDLATNVALVLARRLKGRPMVIAEKLASEMMGDPLFDKVEAVLPGFINFQLSKSWLVGQAQTIADDSKFAKVLNSVLKGKKYLLEHTSPDPIKTIHIGHLRNNFLGMGVSRLLEALGAKVVLDCINNDRGVHVCRAMWGYLVFGRKVNSGKNKADYIRKIKAYRLSDEEVGQIARKADWESLLSGWQDKRKNWYSPADFKMSSDKFDNLFYSLGQRSEDLVKGVGEQVRRLLQAWEKEDKGVRAIWRQVISWSLEGYGKTYARIGSRHDKVWHESDHYKEGKKWVDKGLKKGIFKKLPDGAVLSQLADYGLTNAIMIKSDGTALYHTQDLELTHLKVTTFPSDRYIWDIGSEQTLYLKQLYAICEQLGIGKRSQFFHLSYGFITLKGGEKMSSRYGGVINADDLLDELAREAKKLIEKSNFDLRGKMSSQEKENLAEAVALSAAKYGFLKYSREKDFAFDMKESLSLGGDSGPYLQYTLTRCFSVLGKARVKSNMLEVENYSWNREEEVLLRTTYQFPEVIIAGVNNFDPHYLCLYLFDLAQKFNLFYQKHRIIQENKDEQSARLFLTAVTAKILEKGLRILGIKVLERM